MTAYKTSALNNLLVQETAREAFYEELIDDTIYANILQRYPYTLYTPNFFIRVGLALLTIVISLAILFLFGLFLYSGGSSDSAFRALLVVLAVMSYIALELLVNTKKYFNAGTDNVLMLLVICFLWSAYSFSSAGYTIWAAVVLCVLSFWLCYRFADALMGMIGFIFLLSTAYMFCTLQILSAVPFVLMALSAAVYWLTQKTHTHTLFLYHRKSFSYISIIAVVTFYVCGNYYFISDIVLKPFYYTIPFKAAIPAAPFFWFCTLFTPAGYLLYGIKAKSLLFIRCGVILLAVGVATLQHYYTFMAADILLMLGGLIFIAASGILIVYARKQKRGFVLGSNKQQTYEHLQDVEALVIAQVVSSTNHIATPQQGMQFGGGSSGGGGATGDY